MTAMPRPDERSADGRVEQLGELSGVSGWAIDFRNPASILSVELWAADELIDTARTGLPRRDVCDVLGIDGAPGYRFDPDVRRRIRDAAMRGLDGRLSVRIAGGAPLRSLVEDCTLDMVRTNAERSAPTTGDALRARLMRHAGTAADVLGRAFEPDPVVAAGWVDAIAYDESGLIWVLGWVQDDPVLDRPLVIVDDGAHAAGFAYTLVDRDDLPPGGRGLVGVLHTQWHASADHLPMFFFADGSGRFLQSVAPTPVRSHSAIAPAVRDLLLRADDRYAKLMRDLFRAAHAWDVVPGDADGRLYVDQAAILPGFGLLVSGWAFSPNKASERFMLRTGDRIMAADAPSVARFARADLSPPDDDIDLALNRAGFTAVFRGDLQGIVPDDIVLKTDWSDGTTTNTAIVTDKVRVLGVTTSIEHALNYYPAIEAEAFFPDFAHHATAAARHRFADLTIHEAHPVPAALVLALPANASDLFLTIDTARRRAAALPAEWGIVLAGCADGVRPILLSLFAALKNLSGRRCSLFLTPPGDTTNDILAAIVNTLGLTRFAFVSADALLTERGWAALGEPVDDLTLLEIRDPVADATIIGSAGLDAFICVAATWKRIAAAATPRIGGIAIETADALGVPPHRIVSSAAVALSSRRESPLVVRINAAGRTAHG